MEDDTAELGLDGFQTYFYGLIRDYVKDAVVALYKIVDSDKFILFELERPLFTNHHVRGFYK